MANSYSFYLNMNMTEKHLTGLLTTKINVSLPKWSITLQIVKPKLILKIKRTSFIKEKLKVLVNNLLRECQRKLGCYTHKINTNSLYRGIFYLMKHENGMRLLCIIKIYTHFFIIYSSSAFI